MSPKLLLPIHITEQVADMIAVGAFGLVLLIFLVIGVVLNYHWVHYGVSFVQITLVRVMYFGVSSILLAGMLTALFRMM